MPIQINGKTFYRTQEALDKIGISRPTWFRWMKKNVIEDVKTRDRRGWRLFTEDDINRISKFAHEIKITPEQAELQFDEF